LIKLLICIYIEEANLLNKKPLLKNNLYHISSSLSIYIPVRMQCLNEYFKKQCNILILGLL
jgi:hypothetical protein